jgi:carboxyl-terminal processing protease
MSRYLNTLESEKASKKAKMEDNSKDKKEISQEEKEKQIVIDEIKKKELVQKAKDWVLENSLTKYFKRQRDLSHQDHYSHYFNALTAVYDPHTNYLDPQAKEDFDIRMSKSLEGIGAVLEQNDDFTKVTRIVPGSASHRQGELKAGDVIMRVAQGDEDKEVDLTGMDLREVVGYIRGPKGSKVRLTVKTPNNETKVIPIIRDIVKLEDRLARSTMLESKDHQKIGYVYLPDFYRDHKHNTKQNCTDDIKKEVLKLKEQGMQALIFDLRDNGGGFLEDAKSISGLFIKSGPIVQVKSFNGHVNVLHDLDRDIVYDGPMVVLVNQFSASASEILAAALQDYGRAIIVGSGQTHGKGTVQHLVPLNLRMPPPLNREPMGDLKLTIQKFYRVNGGSTQNKGVIPDIILPDERDHLETGERHLDNALPWDSISAQPYYEWKEPLPIDLLKKNSEKRQSQSDIFQAIIERSEKLKEQSEDTQVHLSISQVVKEREQRREENKAYGELIKELKAKIDKEMGVEAKVENKEEEDSADEESKSLTVEEEKAEEYKAWSKNIGYDPHVRESVNILQDFIHTRKIAGTLSSEPKAKVTQ